MGHRALEILARSEVWVIGLVVAAFLALTWALRGAPWGQSPAVESEPGAPSPRDRDRAVSMVVAGLVMVGLGGFVAFAYGIGWSLPLFGIGLGLMYRQARVNRQYSHASPTMRRVVRFAETALTACLLIGVLTVGNVLAFRYGERPLDFTREKVFTLSDLTIKQARAIDRPLRFTVFFERRITRARRQHDRVLQLLELIRAENPRLITFDVIDPGADPVRWDDLARRAPDVVVASGGVLIEYGEPKSAERLVVRNSEMFAANAYAPNSLQGESSFHGEDAIATALMRLREQTRPKIIFSTGHGEPPTSENDPRQPGLGLLRARLIDVGCQVADLDLARQDVPDDVALAIIAAPRDDFVPADIDRLDKYMAAGGRVLVFLDGLKPAGLDNWLKKYNVEVSKALIVDPGRSYPGRPDWVLAHIGDEAAHPITRPLVNRDLLLIRASPLTPRNTGQRPTPGMEIIAEPIVFTSPRAWGEADVTNPRLLYDPARDQPGPLVAAIAVLSPARARVAETPRLVVIASPYFPQNQSVSVEANLDLIVNAVNWLRGRTENLGIQPSKRVLPRLDPDPNIQARLVLLPTLMAFSIILGLGVAMYLARRA